MTDHKAAVSALIETLNPDTPTQVALLAVGMAQVHAALFLAEQQRLANVIAYWQLHTPRTVAESEQSHSTIEVHQIFGEIDGMDVDAFVQDGLGLS